MRFRCRRVAWAADDRGGALLAECDREGFAQLPILVLQLAVSFRHDLESLPQRCLGCPLPVRQAFPNRCWVPPGAESFDLDA